MSTPRIFYVARPFGVPMGGVMTLYRHVEILRRQGFDASIYLLPGEGEAFVDTTVPIVDGRTSLAINPTDVFVLPEPWPIHLPDLMAQPVRKFVFCQNHFYAFAGMGTAPTYAALGIEGVFASSHIIARFLERNCGAVDVPVIPYAIDAALFRPAPKRRQIAFMPRKLGFEASIIEGLFRRRHPAYADIPWVAIDKSPSAEVALTLGQSRWFLSLSNLEGFGLPPLEAMAAEAVVVGFHGEGGLEYATTANGFWCPTGDLEGCAAALARAVALCDAVLEVEKIAAGHETVARYGHAAQEKALVAFWTSVLAAPAHHSRHMVR